MKTLSLGILAPVFLALSGVANAEESPILSAGLGATILPNIANFAFCRGAAQSAGLGGMPVVFRAPINIGAGFAGDPNGIDPSLFAVTVGEDDRVVQPVCATLAPAVNAGERRTVLLNGPFGLGGSDGPTAVQIIGDLQSTDGQSFRGAETLAVNGVNGGPSLVLAEAFEPTTSGIATSEFGDGTRGRFCPSRKTARVVKLTFSGGVSGPNGAALIDDENAIDAIQVLAILPNGQRTVMHPFALRDDDNDNHLDACFGANTKGLRLVRMSVDAHNFFAPQNVPNKAGAVMIKE